MNLKTFLATKLWADLLHGLNRIGGPGYGSWRRGKKRPAEGKGVEAPAKEEDLEMGRLAGRLWWIWTGN